MIAHSQCTFIFEQIFLQALHSELQGTQLDKDKQFVYTFGNARISKRRTFRQHTHGARSVRGGHFKIPPTRINTQRRFSSKIRCRKPRLSRHTRYTEMPEPRRLRCLRRSPSPPTPPDKPACELDYWFDPARITKDYTLQLNILQLDQSDRTVLRVAGQYSVVPGYSYKTLYPMHPVHNIPHAHGMTHLLVYVTATRSAKFTKSATKLSILGMLSMMIISKRIDFQNSTSLAVNAAILQNTTILKITPRTLHLEHYTQINTPLTLHLKYYTYNTTPQILHLKYYTYNTTPQILHL